MTRRRAKCGGCGELVYRLTVTYVMGAAGKLARVKWCDHCIAGHFGAEAS